MWTDQKQPQSKKSGMIAHMSNSSRDIEELYPRATEIDDKILIPTAYQVTHLIKDASIERLVQRLGYQLIDRQLEFHALPLQNEKKA